MLTKIKHTLFIIVFPMFFVLKIASKKYNENNTSNNSSLNNESYLNSFFPDKNSKEINLLQDNEINLSDCPFLEGVSNYFKKFSDVEDKTKEIELLYKEIIADFEVINDGDGGDYNLEALNRTLENVIKIYWAVNITVTEERYVENVDELKEILNELLEIISETFSYKPPSLKTQLNKRTTFLILLSLYFSLTNKQFLNENHIIKVQNLSQNYCGKSDGFLSFSDIDFCSKITYKINSFAYEFLLKNQVQGKNPLLLAHKNNKGFKQNYDDIVILNNLTLSIKASIENNFKLLLECNNELLIKLTSDKYNISINVLKYDDYCTDKLIVDILTEMKNNKLKYKICFPEEIKYNKYGVIEYRKYPLINVTSYFADSNFLGVKLIDDYNKEVKTIENLENDIKIYIKTDNKFKRQHCIFYDEISKNISDNNCRTTVINEDYVLCSCNHLTDFSLGEISPMQHVKEVYSIFKDFRFINSFEEFKYLTWENGFVLKVYGIIFIVYIILLIPIRYLDIRSGDDSFVLTVDHLYEDCFSKEQVIEEIEELKMETDKSILKKKNLLSHLRIFDSGSDSEKKFEILRKNLSIDLRSHVNQYKSGNKSIHFRSKISDKGPISVEMSDLSTGESVGNEKLIGSFGSSEGASVGLDVKEAVGMRGKEAELTKTPSKSPSGITARSPQEFSGNIFLDKDYKLSLSDSEEGDSITAESCAGKTMHFSPKIRSTIKLNYEERGKIREKRGSFDLDFSKIKGRKERMEIKRLEDNIKKYTNSDNLNKTKSILRHYISKKKKNNMRCQLITEKTIKDIKSKEKQYEFDLNKEITNEIEKVRTERSFWCLSFVYVYKQFFLNEYRIMVILLNRENIMSRTNCLSLIFFRVCASFSICSTLSECNTFEEGSNFNGYFVVVMGVLDVVFGWLLVCDV